MMYDSIAELISSQKAPELPIIIPTFNNPTYLIKMIEQLNKYGLNDIIITDNFSTYPPMREVLKEMSKKYTVVAKFTNDGPRECYENKLFYDWLPEKFILTDPDIGFNESLPFDFVSILDYTSEHSKLFKVGFALDINFQDETFIKEAVISPGITIYSWESSLYNNIVGETKYGDPIYLAGVDTTFCLINKKYDPNHFLQSSARITGNFTAQHYGWYTNPPIPKEEEKYGNDHATSWSSTIVVRKGIK
jgi:glycosyltransferase involved in cell wall biosynthesis